jgi:sodium-dependent phosphate cotransporter
MVNAQIISLRTSIPIIMGANIGTTVTNSIVAFGQAQESEEFKLAFAAASIHDFFNWLGVILQLPLEAAFHPLERLTGVMVSWIKQDADAHSFKVRVD